MHEHDTLPWYRQFWPWLLIGLPAAVVIACVITISIALQHDDPLQELRRPLAVVQLAFQQCQAVERGRLVGTQFGRPIEFGASFVIAVQIEKSPALVVAGGGCIGRQAHGFGKGSQGAFQIITVCQGDAEVQVGFN